MPREFRNFREWWRKS